MSQCLMELNEQLPPTPVANTNFRALPGDSRLLWDPQAHNTVGEFCRFYLLGSRDGRGADLMDAVTSSLRSIGIHGATCHIVYGPMDLLIRVWLSESKRMAFLRTVQQPALDLRLDQFYEFKAESVDYVDCNIVQAGSPPSLETITSLVAALRDSTNSRTVDREAIIRGAVQRKILHNYKSPEGCKVYLFIYGAEGRVFEDVEATDLSRALARANASHITVYRGTGFCIGVIKFICPLYDDTLVAVQAAQDALASRELYCWSLVPPGRNRTLEGETLHLPDSEAESLTTSLMASADTPEREKPVLSVRIEGALGNASTRKRIQELVSKSERALNGLRGRQRFSSILCSVLARDARSINQRLSFLISIESNLRAYLTKLTKSDVALSELNNWPDIGKYSLQGKSTSKWEKLLQEKADVAEFLKALDLPVMIAYIDSFLKEGKIDDRGREATLRECVVHKDLIQRLRDRYAHGVILDLALEESLGEEMWGILFDLIPAIRIQISLEELLSDPEQ